MTFAGITHFEFFAGHHGWAEKPDTIMELLGIDGDKFHLTMDTLVLRPFNLCLPREFRHRALRRSVPQLLHSSGAGLFGVILQGYRNQNRADKNAYHPPEKAVHLTVQLVESSKHLSSQTKHLSPQIPDVAIDFFEPRVHFAAQIVHGFFYSRFEFFAVLPLVGESCVDTLYFA
ncbi:MAG: hypothetical protein LBS00_07885, partial [Synergistaceae bacterium]|nr:hypothetical protein [Synergistaceae bacterium]